MDESEAHALLQLAKRKAWAYDELPVDVDLDMLRCLDDLGLIEARACGIVPNQNARKDPKAPKTRLLHGEWYSPMRRPIIGGKWESIATNHERTEWVHPHEIRVNDSGKAELARANRSDQPSDSKNEQNASIALMDEDLTILAEIDSRKRLVKATELLELSGMPKETMLRKRLNVMQKAKLVERPSGPSSGYQLTRSGREHLRSYGL